jgi:Spy/CpxP family protein refolding chaperone
MFLPEHREAILKQRKEATKFKPHEIDEQQWQEMAYIIEDAVANEQPIEVTYAGEYEELVFCGYVDRVDPQ